MLFGCLDTCICTRRTTFLMVKEVAQQPGHLIKPRVVHSNIVDGVEDVVDTRGVWDSSRLIGQFGDVIHGGLRYRLGLVLVRIVTTQVFEKFRKLRGVLNSVRHGV
ncbi:hypothetical protein AQ914_04455 [Burkholderia pseudomallei]|nr:hypothetical protein AQ914_04455 [Burkholderia pseudomallei]